MISLKEYKKSFLIEECQKRLTRSANMLEVDDYEVYCRKAIEFLDEFIYLPRNKLLDESYYIDNTTNMDISSLEVNEICAIYYSPNPTYAELASITGLGEIGLLPFLTAAVGGGSLATAADDVMSYLHVNTLLNHLRRQLRISDDSFSWGPDAFGRDVLQLRHHYPYIRLEFYPHLDFDHDSLFLYSPEYSFFKDYAQTLLNLASAEYLMSANPLGAFKEVTGVIQHWLKKKEDLEDFWRDKARVMYQPDL